MLGLLFVVKETVPSGPSQFAKEVDRLCEQSQLDVDVTYCWLILILQCTGEPLAQLVEARSIGRRGSQIPSPFPCIDDVDELRDVVRGAGEQGLGVAVMNQTAWLKDRFSSVYLAHDDFRGVILALQGRDHHEPAAARRTMLSHLV
ncbi:hypothetical protein ASPNIDRAFT_41901 [Aspergillus niger ATCC 1015]|uniref:Uncharacterized protein n=1 Tax=Aspergillus niger (strain ATCC 1015 / CBS 113.46 / FGSC A1144 / LSHB Ac4 / NCTC 3858a / NRRL 328 / USDA 3528.7) TaxID=380704 RepID=G3XNQ8_ASPNA|nr:hypothetical protein ASPNIDRAFT_41901 [Aspergillus niger ATCC 1015]